MDETTRKRFEYEEQCFNCSSQFMAESFKDAVKDVLESSIDTLIYCFSKRLLKESKNPEEFKQKIEEMKKKLYSEYTNSLELEFDNIKAGISKAMHIPNHVLLKEDLPIKTTHLMSGADIEADIKRLKGEYKALNYLKHEIHEEVEIADSAIFILDNITDKNKYDFKMLNDSEIVTLTKSMHNLYVK